MTSGYISLKPFNSDEKKSMQNNFNVKKHTRAIKYREIT